MMIDAKAQIQDANNEQKFVEIEAFREDFKAEMEGLQAGFDTQLDKMDKLEKTMAKNQKEYENAQEMLQVNLRKMIKETSPTLVEEQVISTATPGRQHLL